MWRDQQRVAHRKQWRGVHHDTVVFRESLFKNTLDIFIREQLGGIRRTAAGGENLQIIDVRRHDGVFHRTGLHQNLGKAGLPVLSIKNDRAAGLAKIGIDEEGIESLLGERDGVVGAAEGFSFTRQGTGKKEGARVFIELVKGQRRSQRSEGFRNDTGALFVDDQHAGTRGEAEFGNGRNDIDACHLLDLIDRLDARVQHEQSYRKGDAGCQTTE